MKIREFAEKAMGTKDVRIDAGLNHVYIYLFFIFTLYNIYKSFIFII
jgi:hypothetical protein